MNYRIQHTPSGEYHLSLEDSPAHIHVLSKSRQQDAAKLAHGNWLILLFAVWGISDIKALRMSVAHMKSIGDIQFGLRPFDQAVDLEDWLAAPLIQSIFTLQLTHVSKAGADELHMATDPATHPIWLLYQHGQLIAQNSGALSEDQLDKFLRSSFKT